MSDIESKPGASPLDRQDSRVRQDESVAGTLRGFIDRVRSGDLGSLPVIVGLIVIWTVFESLNSVFLGANNLVNLLFDSSTVGVISLGIVCVLMISHNMEDVRAVADRIVVLRLGRNNGVFEPDASNQDLVSAITGASNNAVSRRAERLRAERDHTGSAPAGEQRP